MLCLPVRCEDDALYPELQPLRGVRQLLLVTAFDELNVSGVVKGTECRVEEPLHSQVAVWEEWVGKHFPGAKLAQKLLLKPLRYF